MDTLIRFFASGFYSGYAPFAPGTVGTLVGIAIYFLLNLLSLSLYGILTAAILVAGVWLSSRAEAILGEKDSPIIVVDEIAGFLVTMFALPLNVWTLAGGFLLFRGFDIVKPFPARRIDRQVPGGWGVMLDDVVAGVYANVTIQLLRQVLLS